MSPGTPANVTIQVSDSIGSVTGAFLECEEMDYLYVFAHGAGAGMNHPFMVRLSEALAQRRIGTLRFNFPYMEKGSRRPDVPAVAEKAVVRALDTAHAHFPRTALLAGGKSFGGRMTSQALSRNPGLPVKGVVFAGFPLHPAGKPGTKRAEHLKQVQVPMLFLQGTRDTLAEIGLITDTCQHLPMATLLTFEGADHSFRVGKVDLIPALADSIQFWTRSLAGTVTDR